MLFIEAINKVAAHPDKKKLLVKGKRRSSVTNKDSVDLSSAGHQVKEIHLDSHAKQPLTASSSVFANLIEHALTYLLNSKIYLHSPEELGLDNKDWKLFLQVPPISIEKKKTIAGYLPPQRYQNTTKPLIFHIPVKPSYGPAVEMTLMLSPHSGSPEIPEFFQNFQQESWLPMLSTPYSPEFLRQQVSHYHVFIDQDGEVDQLSPLYTFVNQSRLTEESNIPKSTHGLRIWKAKHNTLEPVLLGDERVGALFVHHHTTLDSRAINIDSRASQSDKLSIKA
ncbi:hypothetical protein OFY17_01605 [Marinomonas sp. C2222]|uniref:Uncharacterized protein n=1 Tax=Marinomonas sargassi TaxID=2984494 RepID=A0ABT2YNV9_9GAMM|nr:hypothetical protein [Marinomonas sargassi]MCV2401567.1 hypothetical protein [Marinomonas sargassi]